MADEKKTTKRSITLVKTVKDIQFLGVNGSQLAAGQGLTFKRVPDGVEVTRDGESVVYTVYAANIAHIREVSE